MPNGVSDAHWSPDGKQIAFLSLDGPAPAKDPVYQRPGDGQYNRLWTLRVGNNNDVAEAITPDKLAVWSYNWSPDCHQFAVYYATGPSETDWFRGQIGLVSAHGGAIRQISSLQRQAYGLTWSPDGSKLAYISGEWSDPDRSGGDIYTLTLATLQTRNLTPGITWSPTWCRWFPDGQSLLCAGWNGFSNQISILHEESGEMQTLSNDFVIGERFWPHLSPTRDLHAFAVTHSDQHPYDVWHATLTPENTLQWKRISRLNPILEETLALAKNEIIRYKSVDGWQIEAAVTWPLEHKGKTPPPLIVIVHGGPSGTWLSDWENYRTQVLAAAGFAVLRPNIRGGMGHGVAFADAVVGDMGGKDFQDIMHGVDYLVKRKLVDAERMGLMGWSYGGFMAAWAVTQTNRFKAAIMGAGISDYHSFHAQSHFQDWDMRFLGKINHPVSPLTHPEIYRKYSPITYAQHVTTPTLIVHGEKDVCVPLNQAHAFYRALQELDVPVELVVYPREGHGLSEREHMQDYLHRTVEWFTHYIG